jgi:predicted nucleic acid-binding protein
LYLDASVLVPLFVPESRSGEAATALVRHTLVVSDFAMAEFSSGIARRARMGEFSGADAAVIL